MTAQSFAVADRQRADLLLRLTAFRRPPLRRTALHSYGREWSVISCGVNRLAVTNAGPNTVFDDYARARMRPRGVGEQRLSDVDAGAAEAVWRLVRLGDKLARLYSVLHVAALGAGTSVFRVSDRRLAAALWSPDRSAWPQAWRREVDELLRGLTRLHVDSRPVNGAAAWGATTAVLTHVADLRGLDDDACDAGHCDPSGVTHHHFLINLGRGFLGALEGAAVDEADGRRRYNYFAGGRERGTTRTSLLQTLGKQGALESLFLPLILGAPDAVERFSFRQRRLLQAIMYEATRKSSAKRLLHNGESFDQGPGGSILDISGSTQLACPFLDARQTYLGFNGNGVRKGRGYLITSAGGWLSKGGYEAAEAEEFLADLAFLAEQLDLTPAAIVRSSRAVLALADVQCMASSRRRRAMLDECHLQIYAPHDFVARCRDAFGDHAAPRGDDPRSTTLDRFATWMYDRRTSWRQAAGQLGVDPSFLHKVVHGHKSAPATLLEKIDAHLCAGGPARTVARCGAPAASSAVAALDAGLDYVARGWSIVPQLPGAKKPCIRWKEFQTRRAGERDVRGWLTQWPTAGWAVVLGRLSDLFVIDVDGEDAHRALLGRLAQLPTTPCVSSGSGDPYRYHLFFRHPPFATSARATPWHNQLEFRGERGIVVLPPSIHASGQPYRWRAGLSLEEVPLAEPPEAVLAALHGRPTPVNDQRVPLCLRQDVPLAASTREFLAGACANGPAWNARLFQAACDCQACGLPANEAEPLLLRGAQPWNDAERRAAVATIRSAYAQDRAASRR